MSTTTTKLINPTDAELSAAVAEHVAGWKRIPAHGTWKAMWENANGSLELDGPWFAWSADAVLPLLENLPFWTAQFDGQQFTVTDGHMDEDSDNMAEAATFPLAACIALLRANGVEVEFTATPERT